jgi:RHS repeat-associated protein
MLAVDRGPNPTYSFDANNHISGSAITYDAAGNIINDGFHAYSYDAEGRMLTVDGGSRASYVYDSTGRRVETTVDGTTSDYLYDQTGHAITRIINGGMVSGELYAGAHIATYYGGTTYFEHSDWLGTVRALSDPSGTRDGICTGLPYGDLLNCSGSSLTMHFTDQLHDFESDLEHFLFRQYNPTQGRWMTPAPAGMAAADPANPQSWNRYAYVMNNPLNATDPLGLQSASQLSNCYFNSGATIGAGNARNPGEECGTGALDSSNPDEAKKPDPIVVPGQTITVTATDEPSATEVLEYDQNLLKQIQRTNQNRAPIQTTLTVSAAPPRPQPLKPGCDSHAVGPALSAMRDDLFSPPGADPKSDMQDLARNKDAQAAAAGTLYVTANAVKPLAPVLDVGADFIPVAGEALFVIQIGHALREGLKAYKESVDHCYGAP